MKGMNTLHLQLDSLSSIPNAKRAMYRVVALGSSAAEGVIHRDFELGTMNSLRDLVAAADEQLGVPSGLISIIQVRATERIRAETPALQFGLVQSLILAKNAAPRQWEIKVDDQGQPLIDVGENGLGTAQTVRPFSRKGPYNIQFAPFDSQFPPTTLIEARAQPRAPSLFIAGTRLELVSDISHLYELEASMYETARLLAETQ